MFTSFSSSKKYTLYSALLRAVESNSGIGFKNGHQGHIVYEKGVDDKEDTSLGDSPEQNDLYQMMRELAESLKDCNDFSRTQLVLSWKDFCSLAVTAYQNSREVSAD